MKKLKKIENFGIFKKSEIGDNLSPEYHLNKRDGKKPFTKKGGVFIEVNSKKSIPSDAVYLTDTQVIKFNKISAEIIKLKELQENILKNN